MGAKPRDRHGRCRSINTTFAAAALAIAATCGLATAQQPAADESRKLTVSELAEVEEAFWLCDYVSTNVGIRATPMGTCLMVTEALKDQKFSGDFDAFVAWWRENKSLEHQRLEKKYTAEAERLRSGTTA